VVIVGVCVALTVVLSAVLVALASVTSLQPGGPAAWALAPGPEVGPGSLGCRDRAGETCFAVLFTSSVAGVRLAGLRFTVVGPPWNNPTGTGGTPVPLGTSASVTALGPTGELAGVWNWSQSAWVQGGSWEVPVDENVTLVLDAGLANAQLAGDYFFTIMATPNYGSVGAYLP